MISHKSSTDINLSFDLGVIGLSINLYIYDTHTKEQRDAIIQLVEALDRAGEAYVQSRKSNQV